MTAAAPFREVFQGLTAALQVQHVPHMSDEPFAGWCIVELMGHRRLAGLVQEQEIAGAAFTARLDVHGSDYTAAALVTQFYSSSAVYCLTPTTEEIARKLGARSQPEPVSPYELTAQASGGTEWHVDDGDQSSRFMADLETQRRTVA